jgi:hypothetical protein
VSGAILGTDQTWSATTKKWNERLAKDDLQYFKSSHCNSLNGQFRKFRSVEDGKKKADQIRDDLDTILRDSQLMTLGVVLPVPFFNAMRADSQKFGDLPSVPYRLAFQQVLAECANAMKVIGRNNIVTFGHDAGEDFHILHAIYTSFKKANPRYAKVMADFAQLDDEFHAPAQAADVAAWVTFRYAEDWAVNPTTDNLKRLRGSMYKIVFWNENLRSASEDRDHESAPARAAYVVVESPLKRVD